MCRHGIRLEQVKFDDGYFDWCPYIVESDDPFYHHAKDGIRAYTDTEAVICEDLDEALYGLAGLLGIHCWREEQHLAGRNSAA